MMRPLAVYDFATAPFLNFLMYEENLIFFFISALTKQGPAELLERLTANAKITASPGFDSSILRQKASMANAYCCIFSKFNYALLLNAELWQSQTWLNKPSESPLEHGTCLLTENGIDLLLHISAECQAWPMLTSETLVY
jgi:hypothetical protein